MYANGKIIFDKTGIVSQLKQEAVQELNKPFKELDSITLELTKYGIYDEFENLKDNYDN